MRRCCWQGPNHGQTKIKASYPELFKRCQETFACFLHTPDPRGAFEVSEAEREAFYEKLYSERGKSLTDVANALGIGPRKVRYHFQKAGIPCRQRGRPRVGTARQNNSAGGKGGKRKDKEE